MVAPDEIGRLLSLSEATHVLADGGLTLCNPTTEVMAVNLRRKTMSAGDGTFSRVRTFAATYRAQ
jgi:hypothetical protein